MWRRCAAVVLPWRPVCVNSFLCPSPCEQTQTKSLLDQLRCLRSAMLSAANPRRALPVANLPRVCPLLPPRLCLGGGILSAPARRGQRASCRLAGAGVSVATDSVALLAGANPLRRGEACGNAAPPSFSLGGPSARTLFCVRRCVNKLKNILARPTQMPVKREAVHPRTTFALHRSAATPTRT